MAKFIVIHSPMDMVYNMQLGLQVLKEQISEPMSCEFYDTYTLDNNPEKLRACEAGIASATMAIILLHGGLCQFKQAPNLLKSIQGKHRFFLHSGIEDENRLYIEKCGLTRHEYEQILAYVANNNAENYKRLFIYLAVEYGSLAHAIESPEPIQWEGIFEPEGFEADRRDVSKPVVAILFYTRYFHEGDTDHIEALMHAVRNSGAEPLAIYTASAPNAASGCKGLGWVISNYLMEDHAPVVHAIINTIGHSQSVLATPGDGSTRVAESIFEQIGVPVIQAMSTYQSLEDWQTNLRGIDSMSFVGSVYYPEFDGQIISTTFAHVKWVQDEIGMKMQHCPIEERVVHVAVLACNWAKLACKSNSEKKIAILFHNMPPRNDMIGCAFGLDTAHCVYDMVQALEGLGVPTEYAFENPDDIIYRIIAAVSNDQRWLSPEETMKRSVDIISGDGYRHWFSGFSEQVQMRLKKDWGEAPGEFMVHEDALPVPGILNGNIFIGLQPPRGYEEQADAVYHSTDIVAPHQYHAYYEWLKNTFQADVIAHIGTHGTLEWLPGKEIGLSEHCMPDVAVSELPHLYPYAITVLGEGIQAKRRSNAVILDHMIPSLTLSETYDHLEEIESLLLQYHQARQTDRAKIPLIEESLIPLAIASNLHIDLGISEEDLKSAFGQHMEALHLWVDEIKNTLIKDGLHYYGKVDEGTRYEQLICALLRLDNGAVPSLPCATAKALGMDYSRLKDYPLETDAQGITNLQKANDVETKSREIITKLIAEGFSAEQVSSVIQNVFGTSATDPLALESINQVLTFAATVVKDKLAATTDEMRYFLEGINGRFVPPGQGGAPTRGNVHILPSGRNFYAIDPASIPSRASWRVGRQLAEQLVDRFKKEEGRSPESIAIVVYAGETMKTNGDDIAQILWLMGIQPVWLEGTDKVIALEAMPTDALLWPRVDVTLRISGLFRDTFPNLIEWIEEAVQIAIGLDEPDAVNYLKKHYQEEVRQLLADGYKAEAAQEEARIRVFSDPPGTYGAGVDTLINSKNWNSVDDLGQIYTFWGGHAYGKQIHGKRVTEVFSRRLAQAEITVKNESSMEIDMLESDDFYNYHGGLIAAVRKASGQKPKSYCGDTSDPNRVKLNDVREQSAKIMRARILNPKWFEGLKEHGYKGAQEVSGMMDFVFGWDATADVIEDWMYDGICDHFLMDEVRRDWIASVNPWAIHNMSERLLEASQRGMWETDPERLDKLRQLYLEVEGDIEGYE